MSEAIVTAFLMVAVVAYAVTGGADFGVGIVELFAPSGARASIRAAGERAIAPIWEANHIWIILALVIVFVGFPEVHVQITTALHIPLVVMLIGIVLRGAAFTFRYYDVRHSSWSLAWWSVLFRTGSFIVPLAFGHLAAAMSRGRLAPSPVDVWSAYIAPWFGWFPFATGLFCAAMFAWLAAVFLVGETPDTNRGAAVHRARRWTVAAAALAAVTTLTALLESVPWLTRALGRPALWGVPLLAGALLIAVWRLLPSMATWATRSVAGLLVALVLSGYFGSVYPVALELADGTVLTWSSASAPQSTMDALSMALLVAGALVIPGLLVLYALFSSGVRPSHD